MRKASTLLVVSIAFLVGCIAFNSDDVAQARVDPTPTPGIVTHVPRYTASAITGLEDNVVAITTELEYYPVGTDKVLVTWKNNSAEPIGFGTEFALEKECDSEWVPVQERDDVAFISLAYGLKPGMQRKMMYKIDCFAKSIQTGEYRIKVSYHPTSDNHHSDSKTIYAYFTVTDDESLIRDSELDAPNAQASK